VANRLKITQLDKPGTFLLRFFKFLIGDIQRTMSINNTVLWDLMPCNLVRIYSFLNLMP